MMWLFKTRNYVILRSSHANTHLMCVYAYTGLSKEGSKKWLKKPISQASKNGYFPMNIRAGVRRNQNTPPFESRVMILASVIYFINVRWPLGGIPNLTGKILRYWNFLYVLRCFKTTLFWRTTPCCRFCHSAQTCQNMPMSAQKHLSCILAKKIWGQTHRVFWQGNTNFQSACNLIANPAVRHTGKRHRK